MPYMRTLAPYMRLPAWNYRIAILSLVAATAIMLALFVVSPSLVQGAPTPSGEAAPMLSSNTQGHSIVSWDNPPITQQSGHRQANANGPATIEECGEEVKAGRALSCTRNSFSVKTVYPDGSYHINWSEWAGRQTGVDRYTVQRLRFMYRHNFESGGASVKYWDYTEPDVNSCWPWAVEIVGREVTRFAWSCNGITNARVDPSGAPTSVEMLETFDDNYTSPSWNGSFEAPGRKHDVPVQALLIPGDRDAPHDDNPQSWRDRLTQQQVDDGTQDLTVTEVEMHLFLVTVHYEDESTRAFHDLVDAGPFPDR